MCTLCSKFQIGIAPFKYHEIHRMTLVRGDVKDDSSNLAVGRDASHWIMLLAILHLLWGTMSKKKKNPTNYSLRLFYFLSLLATLNFAIIIYMSYRASLKYLSCVDSICVYRIKTLIFTHRSVSLSSFSE